MVLRYAWVVFQVAKLKRLEWNARHRPLSFSHQEVTSECAKASRQLRHSYSQREVSRHSRQVSVDTLANSTTDLKNPEPVGAWSGNNPAVTKSTPHLLQGRSPRHIASSSSLHGEADETGANNMVTRRFKKGSVYDALASTSGLDFAPVVQLKAFNSRRDEALLPPKPPEKIWEKTQASKLKLDNSPAKDNAPPVFNDPPQTESMNSTFSTPPKPSEVKRTPSASKFDGKEVAAKCLTAHEKYPSWPVVESESPSVSQRSHSWTGKTDYPKEKVAYSRPKKAQQYKISTNQLQPVLERAPDYNVINTKSPEALIADAERSHTKESFRVEFTGGNIPSGERNGKQYPECSSTGECNGQEFDFEAFHTPVIPECFEDKDYRMHSPPERDAPSASPSSKAASEAPSAESNGFLSRYEEVMRNQAQYSSPLSTWNKERSENTSGGASPDTPFMDRLRLDNGLQVPPPRPVPIQPLAAVAQLPQQLHQQANDIELASENGTWMGSMESSSHGRGVPKWQGSYSDLSTLSTQLSNRSSLFDSGHSTMPESGRLSPQSSCDSTAPSLLLEGPTRAQVVARHGCHREIVAHSARVQQPERHDSESILYYATGTTRSVPEGRSPSKSVDGASSSSHTSTEESLFRSHASLTLSPSQETITSKCPTRQDSRKSSNSYSSDDSYSRPRGAHGDDTSGSSSDVSNVTCISNYKGGVKSTPPKRSEKSSPREAVRAKALDQTYPKYKPNSDPPKSKSMDETATKFVFPDPEKKQRASDPELKAIQKQAVMSFYERMSLASEASKAEAQATKLIHAPGSDPEPPPPYEAKLKMPPPKLSLPKVTGKQPPPRPGNQISQPKLPMKAPEVGLLNAHSKSVPNLMMLKNQGLDLPASHPIFKKPFGSKMMDGVPANRTEKKRGSPLATEAIISWDQLPIVLEKQREAMERTKYNIAIISAFSERPNPANDSIPMHLWPSAAWKTLLFIRHDACIIPSSSQCIVLSMQAALI
ncbi:hypothetical protein JTE90_028251 [Oedothorax gibbosus]|uniref:Uncharacterized protein n=1 Tax=Oedothorax gibbosus TaxID=931172 RepID=A0AAV6URS6_9ARAC|nr:hypothetical protein JTE90_028251 [Oedothorax gibbosus]